MCAVQKVARSHVRVVLPFGFKYHRGTRKTGPYQDDPVRSSADSHRLLYSYQPRDITGSAIWRMRAALRHHDRVREISFGGYGVTQGEFIKATSYHFPALESLFLIFPHGPESEIPATFLRGPDQSDPGLRRLTLYGGSVAFLSGLLLSATALNDLTLGVLSTNSVGFDPSGGSALLACLRGTQCLRSLHLTIEFDFRDFPSQHSTPKDIFPLLL
jgi:hypothetical protein